jgi:DNA polymerase III subunit delta'
MQALNPKRSHIIIASDIEATALLVERELEGFRVVKFLLTQESFKIEHTKAVVAEAYLSESSTKYIVIGAYEITDVAQNALLKLLEEPPLHIEFIIISPTKSVLLPTVRSRLPLFVHPKTDEVRAATIALAKLDYKEVFTFLKEHARIKKEEAKELVEALFKKATQEEHLTLNESQLQSFEMAMKLLNLNARPQSVLAMLLMGFAKEK